MAPDDTVVTAEPFIVWLDPGLITGLASYDLKNGAFLSWQYEEDDLVRRLHSLSELCEGRMQVGWEAFLVGNPKQSTSKYSQEVIGRIKDFAFVHDVEVLKSQPSSSRALGSRVMLRRLGWYKPGKVHANDASQHLLSHLLKMRPMPHPVREKLFPGYKPSVTIAP